MAAAHDWVEITLSSSVDAGELLGRFNDPSAAGARLLVSGILPDDRVDIATGFGKVGGVVMDSRARDGWLALEIMIPESCEGASA